MTKTRTDKYYTTTVNISLFKNYTQIAAISGMIIVVFDAKDMRVKSAKASHVLGSVCNKQSFGDCPEVSTLDSFYATIDKLPFTLPSDYLVPIMDCHNKGEHELYEVPNKDTRFTLKVSLEDTNLEQRIIASMIAKKVYDL